MQQQWKKRNDDRQTGTMVQGTAQPERTLPSPWKQTGATESKN
ncbi:hypothetical protein NXW88_21835 [Bacteroides cellulosilyticus]|nr:hypothetical protein [Bacteroides cellulosilyticus]UVP50227.1 hypothetical protein NXW88_21835 [Bacteroides cellulosilyticus]